jgi:hypothetical protein
MWSRTGSPEAHMPSMGRPVNDSKPRRGAAAVVVP